MPTRRFYANSAPQQALASGITSGATSLTIQSSFAGWPTSFPFFAVLETGTANQEIISITNIVGLVATVVRGQDSSTAVAHSATATLDQMVIRQDLDEANAHTSANSGVHGVAGQVADTSSVQTFTNKTYSGGVFSGSASGTIGGSASVNTSGAVTAASVNGGSLIAPITRVYTAASNTWTKPAGIRGVRVRVVGPGGAGGGSVGGASGRAIGSGGGSGEYGEQWIPAASLLATETVTVGQGGTGASGANGGNGSGPSSFGTHVTAAAGQGGLAGANASGAAGTAGGTGGTGGTGGDFHLPGGDGGNGIFTTSTQVVAQAGYGGGNPLGFPKAGPTSAGSNGVTGNNYGVGGTGSVSSTVNQTGGNGAGGVVIVEEIY